MGQRRAYRDGNGHAREEERHRPRRDQPDLRTPPGRVEEVDQTSEGADKARKLTQFDGPSTVAAFAALQLYPANAHQLERLELATTQALKTARGQHVLTLESAATFASAGSHFRELAKLEDPAEEVLCEMVLGPGGGFLVGTGLSEQSVFALKLLSRALFQFPAIDRALVAELVDPFRIALTISDHVLRAAGLSRGMPRGGAPMQPVEAPADGAHLLETVRIPVVENAELPTVLEPLLWRFGNPSEEPSAARPFVLTGQELIVAYPFEIAAALRHHAANKILDSGFGSELSTRLILAAFAVLHSSMQRLGMTPLESLEDLLPTTPAPELPGGEALYRFDDDKVAHALLIADDLSAYQRDELFQFWSIGELEARAQERAEQVRDHLLRRPDVDVVHSLFVAAPLDRGLRFGVPDSLEVTFMPLRDLETFSHAARNDPLSLWKLAQAIGRLTALGELLSFSPLDVDQFLRESHYEIPDVDQPTLIVARPGGGGMLREEQARRIDVHPAPHPTGVGVEVERWLPHAPSVPIYLPRESPWEEFECLVEGDAVFVWVVGPNSEAGQAVGHTIAYWLWQALPDIAVYVDPLLDANDTLLVRFDLEPNDGWKHETDLSRPRGPLPTGPFARVRDISGAETLVLTETAWWELQSADNEGERHLLRHLLVHLARGAAGSDVIDEIVERRAPRGYKKQLLFGSGPDTRLSMQGLPREFRAVQLYDRARARERLSSRLLAEQSLEPGLVAEDKAQALVHDYVGCAYRELRQRLADFASDGLLERLILLNERLVQEQAHLRTTALTNTLAYGDIDESLAERDAAEARVAEAAIATRFLIELVATCPPHGGKHFSLADFDELLALAAELIGAGRIGDALHFGLGEPEVALFGGRLLFSPGAAVVESLTNFNTELLEAEVATGDRILEDLVWRPPAELAELPVEIDDAITTELGVSLHQIGLFLNALLDHGVDTEAGVVTATLAEVTALLGQAGLSDEAQIGLALDRFSLGPRSEFLKPSPPDTASDVYPWRANRSLSFVRRPFVRRGEQVLYGIRHLYNAQTFLVRMIESGRFPARTTKLRRLQGKHGRLLGRWFEDAVADLFDRHDYPNRVRVTQLQGRPVADDEHALGDIDVLVADELNQCLIVIDAKNLGPALNTEDLLRQSEQLLGTKKSAATRTKARAEWVTQNRDAAAIEFANPAISSWSVDALVVTDRVLPAAHLAVGAVPVVSYGLLKQRLDDQRLRNSGS